MPVRSIAVVQSVQFRDVQTKQRPGSINQKSARQEDDAGILVWYQDVRRNERQPRDDGHVSDGANKPALVEVVRNHARPERKPGTQENGGVVEAEKDDGRKWRQVARQLDVLHCTLRLNMDYFRLTHRTANEVHQHLKKVVLAVICTEKVMR